ncbi:MAG: transglycosylase SLT domain-containing protein [Paludibacteraceae bacterium]|nr:transglycosylase SLT domain-containing protein [Paludibacteraceae bacterium]
MKKFSYIILLLISSISLSAQEVEPQAIEADTLAFAEDTSIVVMKDSVVPYTQDDLDKRIVDYTLSWLDTTDCSAVADTTRLPDSVYIARLRSLPYIIEMPYNQIVRGFIDMYVLRRPRQVARLRTLSGFYFPLFEEKLHQYGLPEELKYLPIIESGLNPTAYSPVGAAGLWQFMPRTAKNSGLEVNSLVDERLDPIKATDAACRFLRSLYVIYGDWNLVIAAYNCGPGNINKAIRRANGKRDFWDIWPYLPRETRSYLPIFIAANYALNFADEHNICMTPLPITLAADTILTDRRLHLLQVSEITGIPMTELRRLNPQYRMDVLPGSKPYALCLPIDMTGAFIMHEDTIYKHKADTLINNRREVIDMAQKLDADGLPATGAYTYTVKKGDTLGAIAKKHKTTVAKIKKWNHLKSDMISIGQKLKMFR